LMSTIHLTNSSNSCSFLSSMIVLLARLVIFWDKRLLLLLGLELSYLAK
jgi:hypothetical protein